MKKIIEVIKKKWLRDTILTIVLVAILIAAFIGINLAVQSLNITPLDFTKEKAHTLSDESKDLVKDIHQEVSIYFFGYNESNTSLTHANLLANQYNKVNSNIKAEIVNLEERPDLAQKYGVSAETTAIIVQAPERFKILTTGDFYTYDTNSYEEIDITEQKLTNAIIDTTISEKPEVYFLTGHGEYDISTELQGLAAYLENDVNGVQSLNLLQTEIPENCSVLVIGTPQKDFEEYEANKIIEYIRKGGKILWMNDSSITEVNYPNIQKILDEYGVGFNKGIVFETSNDKMILQQPQLVIPNTSYHAITKDIYQSLGTVMLMPGKLEVAADEKLEELGVTITPFLTTSETSCYREEYSSLVGYTKTATDEQGSYIVGAELSKKIDDNTESKLIVYTNNIFASNNTITIGEQKTTLLGVYDNKDLVLNTIAYLTDREDTIRIRKDTGAVFYTATESQDIIVRSVIFIVPALIVLAGIIVWQVRRRKK